LTVDRRWLIRGGAAAVIALPASMRSVAFGASSFDTIRMSQSGRWHPLVETILDRAQIDRPTKANRTSIERTIKRRAEATAYKVAPIIWLETPADAHKYLCNQGLGTLLEADVTRFWKPDDSLAPRQDFDFPESAYEAQWEAETIFRVDQREADVGQPKRAAKDRAIERGTSAQDIFETRALSSQIGWLETVIARAAAYSIYQIELLLSMGMPEDASEMNPLRDVFDAHEHGLLATWETANTLVCVTR
jgi:hypothetical protein